MAVTVNVPTIMRKHVDGQAQVQAEGSSLKELLDNLEAAHPGVTKNIIAEGGGLHRFINIYVNDEDVRYLGGLDAPLDEGDSVSILPAVAGGS
jgi:MoaD family protein